MFNPGSMPRMRYVDEAVIGRMIKLKAQS